MTATDDSRQQALARVRSFLSDLGTPSGEIERAEAEGMLDVLVVDRILFPSGERYTQSELAERTGLPLELLRRFWTALGFLDVDEDDRAFTELDVEAAELFRELLRSGVVDLDTAVHLARVIGSSMARIADAEVLPRFFNTATTDDPVIVADNFARTVGPALPSLARLLEFVWRRHLQAASRRTMLLRAHGQVSGSNPVLAVGFADMVGFTLLSQHLSDEELGQVVTRFEELAHGVVIRLGGHVVKTIGDEVMFVVDGVVQAAQIGLELAEAYADDDLLSDVRVGLALGTVVTRDGDYFGPTVNLAHRIVNIANPGSVIVSDAFRQALQASDPESFRVLALRPRILKDLGQVQLWWLGRPGQDLDGSGGATDQRRRERWERIADVLRDLDELRETGQEVVASGLLAAMTRPRTWWSLGESHGERDASRGGRNTGQGDRDGSGVRDVGQAYGGDSPRPEGQGPPE